MPEVRIKRELRAGCDDCHSLMWLGTFIIGKPRSGWRMQPTGIWVYPMKPVHSDTLSSQTPTQHSSLVPVKHSTGNGSTAGGPHLTAGCHFSQRRREMGHPRSKLISPRQEMWTARLRLLNQTSEKGCDVAGEGQWFFGGCEMPAALHRCPPLDVI
jgi:hypothetical protein